MDCSLPGSSLHGILQARILEWVAISFSRGIKITRNGICLKISELKFAGSYHIFKSCGVFFSSLASEEHDLPSPFSRRYLASWPDWPLVQQEVERFSSYSKNISGCMCYLSARNLLFQSFFWNFSPLFKTLLLYWSIVDFQCCACFRYTAKWFSCTHTSILFQIFSHIGYYWQYSTLFYTVGPCWCLILYIVLYVC